MAKTPEELYGKTHRKLVAWVPNMKNRKVETICNRLGCSKNAFFNVWIDKVIHDYESANGEIEYEKIK